MASLKTSQETSGYPLQKNDLHRIARSGNNHKVNSEELFSEVLTYTQFETKRTAGNLIAGRWYKVSECGYDLSQTILVLADTNISWNPRIKWLTGNDAVECDAVELNQGWIKYYDSEGNTYYNYHNAICEFQPIGKGVNWKNVIVDKGSQCCFNSTGGTNGIESSYFNTCTLNLENYQIINSNLQNVSNNNKVSGVSFLISESNFNSVIYDDNKNGGQISFLNCNFKNVNIYFNGNGAVTFTNVNLENVSILVDGGCDIQQSSFSNCSLEIVNVPQVLDLNIIGKGSAISNYKIDGAFQDKILDSWAGTVVADSDNGTAEYLRTGFSTVKMRISITDDFSGMEGTFDIPSQTLYIPVNTPVGIFLINNLPDNQPYDLTNIQIGGDINHIIELAKRNYIESQEIKVAVVNSETDVSSSQQVVKYHNMPVKVQSLYSPNSFIKLKYQFNNVYGGKNWYIIYGSHYDVV